MNQSNEQNVIHIIKCIDCNYIQLLNVRNYEII